MELKPYKLITIICESIIRDDILEKLEEFGASGYTYYPVNGKGSRGSHMGDFEGPHMKIETIVSPPIAEKILAFISGEYFRYHSLIIYQQNAEIVRGSKYA